MVPKNRDGKLIPSMRPRPGEVTAKMKGKHSFKEGM